MTNRDNNNPYRWMQADWNVCIVLPALIMTYVVAVNLWGFQ